MKRPGSPVICLFAVCVELTLQEDSVRTARGDEFCLGLFNLYNCEVFDLSVGWNYLNGMVLHEKQQGAGSFPTSGNTL